MQMSAPAAVSPRFAGRYDLVRPLKRGAAVTTWLARDTGTPDASAAEGDPELVVVKVFDLTMLNAATRERFTHETKVLAALSGAGLARLRDAGQTDAHVYLVQDHIPGDTLETALAGGPLPVRVALRIGIEVGSALETAHGAAVLHRDVKPANIVLTGLDRQADAVDAVTLIDFGLARSPLLDEQVRDDLVGTVRYLAPEAAGSLAVPVDGRSDLYALGIVLYESLAGRPPFPGP